MSQNNQFGYYGTEILNINPYTFFDRSIIIEPTYQYSDISGGTYSGSSALTNPYANGMYYAGVVNGGPQTVDPTVTLSSNLLNRMGTTSQSGTITFSTTHGGSTIAHFKIPIFVGGTQPNDIKLDTNKYYYVQCSLSTPTVSKGTVTNVCLKDENESIVTSLFNTDKSDKACFKLGSELLTYRSYIYGFYAYYCFDYMLGNSTSFDSFNLQQTGSIVIKEVADKYQSSINIGSSDAQTHQKLDSLNTTQESIKDTEEDTNETTHSIFDSITSFFGSFFSNLIGVFVPEDGYFTSWFNRVNTMLTDKLGILYYPFGYLISFLSDFLTLLNNYDNDLQHCYIDFPAIEFTNVATNETYTFLQATTVDLADFSVPFSGNSYVQSISNRFNNIVSAIRIFNCFALIFALFNLSYRKVKLILEGHEDDN